MHRILLFLLIPLFWGVQPAFALPTPLEASTALYQAVPDFPKGTRPEESQADQSLIRRLITYHLYIKNRSPYSRFDWKLTLADYLGYNEIVAMESYPGRDALGITIFINDQRLINKLSPGQRETLILNLLKIYRDSALIP